MTASAIAGGPFWWRRSCRNHTVYSHGVVVEKPVEPVRPIIIAPQVDVQIDKSLKIDVEVDVELQIINNELKIVIRPRR